MTQTYNVSAKQLTSNYAVLRTLEPNNFVVGQSMTVASVASPFNGTFQILDIPEYYFMGINSTTGAPYFDTTRPIENQVLYACTGDDVLWVVVNVGTIAYSQVCSWVTAADIEAWLGIAVATAADQTFITQCASAANQFIYRRRQEAGYFDSLTTSPSGDVTLGTIMYGGALYRQRGSIDQFASFTEMGQAPVTGLSPIIMQLCGLNRPAVA
jgi:hypothetical protein